MEIHIKSNAFESALNRIEEYENNKLKQMVENIACGAIMPGSCICELNGEIIIETRNITKETKYRIIEPKLLENKNEIKNKNFNMGLQEKIFQDIFKQTAFCEQGKYNAIDFEKLKAHREKDITNESECNIIEPKLLENKNEIKNKND